MNRIAISTLKSLCLLSLLTLLSSSSQAQESTNGASINSSIGHDGTGTIVVEARGQLPKPPVFFTASAKATVQVGSESVEQTIEVAIKIVQGDAETLSLGITGEDHVIDVQSEQLKSWSLRREGALRFLELNIKENVPELNAQIKTRSRKLDLKAPDAIDVTHITRGDSVGFDSNVILQYASGVEGVVTEATGFAPRFQ